MKHCYNSNKLAWRILLFCYSSCSSARRDSVGAKKKGGKNNEKKNNQKKKKKGKNNKKRGGVESLRRSYLTLMTLLINYSVSEGDLRSPFGRRVHFQEERVLSSLLFSVLMKNIAF